MNIYSGSFLYHLQKLQDSLVFNKTDTRTGSEKMLTVFSSQYENYIKKKRKNLQSGNNYISTLIKHILGHENLPKDRNVSHRLAIFGPGIESYRTKQIVSAKICFIIRSLEALFYYILRGICPSHMAIRVVEFSNGGFKIRKIFD